jgi:two-component system, LuxR family, sensor histidine kinase DctS
LNQDLRDAMQRIAAQAERAGQVIRSVNNFVRRRDQARERVAAQSLIDAVMPLVQLQAEKSGIRVLTEVSPQLPPTLCDRTMVEQVLLNLTRNGMQAMEGLPPPRRELRIGVQAAAKSDASLVFSVQDLGQGISPDVAQQLFTPFFSTKAEGMGLGLSLCRTVVEQHGGKLSFENLAQGGTVFRFSLPTTGTDNDHNGVP